MNWNMFMAPPGVLVVTLQKCPSLENQKQRYNSICMNLMCSDLWEFPSWVCVCVCVHKTLCYFCPIHCVHTLPVTDEIQSVQSELFSNLLLFWQKPLVNLFITQSVLQLPLHEALWLQPVRQGSGQAWKLADSLLRGAPPPMTYSDP